MTTAPSAVPQPASLVVIDPSGRRARIPLQPLPFRIGRHAESHLIIRDSRASRTHARILIEGGEYVVEDCNSRHGTFVNGRRVTRRALQTSDRIDFGAQDGYQLVFALDGAELKRLMEQVAPPEKAGAVGVGANLAKLRAILDLARTIYDERAFERLPILADALMDAGCADEQIIAHCRGDGPNVRGCWVVDLVLGKE